MEKINIDFNMKDMINELTTYTITPICEIVVLLSTKQITYFEN